LEVEHDRGDAPAAAFLCDREIGLGLEPLRRLAGAAELKRQRHGEAAGMRRGDQFLRVGALAVAEERGERIRRLAQRAALRGQAATAVLARAVPDRGRIPNDRRHVSLLVAALDVTACARAPKGTSAALAGM